MLSQQLEGLNGFVIPGGESTVMIKLLVEFGMYDAVKAFGASGTPIFGEERPFSRRVV